MSERATTRENIKRESVKKNEYRCQNKWNISIVCCCFFFVSSVWVSFLLCARFYFSIWCHVVQMFLFSLSLLYLIFLSHTFLIFSFLPFLPPSNMVWIYFILFYSTINLSMRHHCLLHWCGQINYKTEIQSVKRASATQKRRRKLSAGCVCLLKSEKTRKGEVVCGLCGLHSAHWCE